MGITMRDLFSDTTSQIVATYPYTDESGQLLFEVVRFEPKDFRQRRPDGAGGWIWNLNGVRRVLLNLPTVIKAKSVLVVEGEKDCDTAAKMGFVATCNPGGAGKWREEYSEILQGKHVAIIADADMAGSEHAQEVAASLNGKTEFVKVIELPEAKDLTAWVGRGGTRLGLIEMVHNALPWTPDATPPRSSIVAVSIGELLTRAIRPREMLLDPVIPEQGLVEIYSYRGIGKTFVGLGIAMAVASGTSFLRWAAPRPRRVLYVDGEMPAKAMQERTAMILAGMEGAEPAPDALRIITPDLQERPMPDLGTTEGQDLLESHLEGIDLVILDNLSCLCRYGRENNSEDWLPMQEWLLRLRKNGMSGLFFQHAGKGGLQRGTSKREDLLDIVIKLKHPSDYKPSEGMRCEVHFEKGRGLFGDSAKPFEIRLESGPDARAIWTHKDLDDAKDGQAAELFQLGMSVRDVAEELGISKSAAHRLRAKCNGNGSVPRFDSIDIGTAGQLRDYDT
jgi:putative DNA primase/helicase